LHIEDPRIGDSRDVHVELGVNGIAVDRTRTEADGTPLKVRFDAPHADHAHKSRAN
jgi:hypothetical protein